MVGSGNKDKFKGMDCHTHSDSLGSVIDMKKIHYPWETRSDLVRYEITHQKKGVKNRDYIYLIETHGEPIKIVGLVNKNNLENAQYSPNYDKLRFENNILRIKECLENNIGYVNLPYSEEGYYGKSKGFNEEYLIEITPFGVDMSGNWDVSLFVYDWPNGDRDVCGFYHLSVDLEFLKNMKKDCYLDFLGTGKISIRKRNLELLASTIELE